MEVSIIKIRKGLNGFRYSACDEKGHFIINGEKISDLTHFWRKEKSMGYVRFVRELKKTPIDTRVVSLEKMIREIADAIGDDLENSNEL